MERTRDEGSAPRQSRNQLNLWLDIGAALLFAVEMEVHFTGLPLHEWLGVGLALLLAIHVALHWGWVVGITRTFFKKLLHESRVNYVLNLALFVDFVLAMLSGIVISRTLGLELGIAREAMTTWQLVHIVSAQVSLVLVALHVGMHWRWIVAHAGRPLLHRLHALRASRPSGAIAPSHPEAE